MQKNLIKKKKIEIQESQNFINFSFMNMLEEKINLQIPKKEYKENEKMDKLSEIVNKLINDKQALKEENKELKEKVGELVQFKLEIEKEREREREEKYYNLKNSSILKDKEKVKMISNWIMPNRDIIYTQIYKSTRDRETGKDFHR